MFVWFPSDTELLVLKFEYDLSFHGNHEILTSQFYLEIILESTYWAARPIFEKGKSKVKKLSIVDLFLFELILAFNFCQIDFLVSICAMII